MSDLSPRSTRSKPPAATLSIHGDFLESAVPQWLVDATPARKSAVKQAAPVLPGWYKNASPAQRKAVDASFKASATAQNRLDKTLSTLLDIDAFAEPLLLKELKERFSVEVDVNQTFLRLKRALTVSILEVEAASYKVLALPMLQAALHNFEAAECEAGAYHSSSGFTVAGAEPDTFRSVSVNLSVSQFLTVCRRLDLGAKYQAYLQSFFHPADTVTEATLRRHFIASQKTAMRAAAEQALLTRDIEPADYAMIVSVINGEVHPWMGDKQVWFKDMGLMKKRMIGCMAFVICEKYRYSDEVILYIPHDRAHPLKRYTSSQMRDEFKRLFTARGSLAPTDPGPTEYQRFYSQFVPYHHRPYYFSQFSKKTADSPSGPLTSPWRTVIEVLSGVSNITRLGPLPPEPAANMEPEPDPYIAASTVTRKGAGIWADNVDPWTYLYEQNRDKVLADARSHAVPTEDVDVKAREAKLAHLLEIGMLALNAVSLFVPVLGEIMLTVMAGQLLYETLEGSIEWAEGDKRAAKEHLVDVAENLAQIAVMAAVGAGVGRFRAVKPEPLLESLSPVTLPNGETRLWRPDLGPYESSVSLAKSSGPNALGQHLVDGKTCIRQGTRVYEKTFDESIKKWRIVHPADAGAYQPLLDSNGQGAWRHSLERPLEWDRLTLLRRMGHVTEAFSDVELIKVADVSGVSDNALRKMHMDHAAPPPELADALRIFRADLGAGQVIEQLRGTQPIDERYLYVLPLVAEMPRWPANRVLEVYKGPGLSGESVKYGSERLFREVAAKPSIKVSRADILSGELPARILASLDEAEIIGLLGERDARLHDARAQAFGKRITDYARTRKPAIFDSIYQGTEKLDRYVQLLQRTCPGLSESAAEEVLAHAAADDLKQLHSTRRVPLNLLEEARWYARQGCQARAYAGLRSDNIATADSRRLALHTLEKLPGWPQTLRLEVRDGSTRGPLLDSIGSETAPEKKYLVKKGPSFQAFDERSEALNSVRMEGDNFYISLMHAMPDNARQSLGVPQVSQHAQLKQKIIDVADDYRSEAAQLLAPQSQWFRPPVRVNGKLLGYYASGRAPGLKLNLSTRARAIYPELTDAQADGFIRQLSQAGKSDKEIFNLLQNREREYTTLASTLDQWVGRPAVALEPWSAAPDNSAYQHRVQVAQLFKALWRRSPLAAAGSSAARFSIVMNEAPPPLGVDFSHIRELSVGGRGLNDVNADGFLARFPNVETLSIGENGRVWDPLIFAKPSLTTLPRSVEAMTKLKSLTLKVDSSSLATDFSSRLNALTALEELTIKCSGFTPSALLNSLDLSALQKLKRLRFNATSTLSQWPAYVENLARLERLDLVNTSIRALPETLYSGHENLWAGLSLDWSNLPREAFKPAYEYVKNYRGERGHLADLQEMVSGYARGELQSLMNLSRTTTALHENLMTTWDTPETRFAAVEALGTEYRGLFDRFYYPNASTGARFRLRALPWQTGANAEVISALETSWRAAVAQRYGLIGDVSAFELPSPEYQLTAPVQAVESVELPQLPAGSFSHVRTLRLGWPGESIEQTRSFLRAFKGAQTLEISGQGLTEMPVGRGDLPALTRLDLSNNRLVVTPVVQAQLSGLSGLELLDLSGNPLSGLDVSGLAQLKALNMRATDLQAWPAGAENLPQLAWLDLRDNQLRALPPHVLTNDEALMKANLVGNRLDAAGEAGLKSARQRVETARGLPEGALGRFEQEAVPSVFPPQETGWSMARYLLPLPRQTVGLEGAAGFVERLQQLSPTLTDEQALQRLEQLREGAMSDSHIDAQLSAWRQAYETLVRELNGWLYTAQLRATDVSAAAEERRLVAVKVSECWQRGLAADPAAELSLHGLQSDNLPELTLQFAHVRTLDLTGVRCSGQSANGFLNSFAQLRRLVLSGNELTELPVAVERMHQLERLELAANALTDPEPLYRQLRAAPLRWLDLSHNNLNTFSTRAFSRLDTLELSYNAITDWPDGALEASALRTLNLSGNALTTFPQRLLAGNREGLVAGTDLSDNHQLSLNSFEQLRSYSDAHQSGAVMGLTRHEIDSRITELESDSDAGTGSENTSGSDSDGDSGDDDDGYQPLEIILDPAGEAGEPVLAAWLQNTPQALAASRRQLWLQLTQAPGHAPFFHLLSQLRDTQEFRFTRVDLTQRVWVVIEAAAGDAHQRELLFIASQTHNTCIDGRTLTFSAMEVLVFEENALRDVPVRNLRLRGQRLLALSRQLFRLDQIDTLAESRAQNLDRAEVRLQYRIGMTHGWPDGLALPGQPTHMAFGTPISGQRLIDARALVLAAEASDTFYESLIARDYWLNYLRQRYTEAFDALEANALARQDALEDEHSAREPGTDSQERYEVALNLLEIELGSARAQKLIELSRNEVLQLSSGAVETPAPRPASPQPGPSSRQ
ncbi:NEL-type E3 ubiquitin ligase domain-containing protein [Pseudomonas kitaguniensis]|uniref:NEL-type E3 ubiquitin ligase domain-containing protein n=1 Tax=Pseudomonas kitaguniensis TaxID=2607908 RepID=UPI003CFEC99E